MSERLLPILGTVLGTAAGTAIGQPQLGAVAGGALGGLGGGAIKGNPLQGLASGAIGGAGSAIGSQFLGPLLGKGLGKVLPELSDEAIGQAVFAGEEGVGDIFSAGLPPRLSGFDATSALTQSPFAEGIGAGVGIKTGQITGATGLPGLAGPLVEERLALGPAQGTGLLGFSSNQIGRGVGGLIGGGLAGTVASQLIQGGGPQPVAPPSLPANIGPRPAAPPNLQQFVVRTGGGLPQTLEELLRRR